MAADASASLLAALQQARAQHRLVAAEAEALACKLHARLQQKFAHMGQSAPGALLDRVRAAQEALATLAPRCSELNQERTAVVDRVARLVLENRLAAMRLHALTRAAPEAEALAADAAVIAPLLGALSEWGADATLSPETRALVASLSAEVAAAQQRQESAGGARGAGGCDEDASATAAEESENAAPASGANRWISEADFSALPASVRGRCSLATVTRALELVCKHFANCGERYPTPLSLKALSAMGAKATGATGANVISSLRALKLVSVSKEGLLLTSEGWRLARA